MSVSPDRPDFNETQEIFLDSEPFVPGVARTSEEALKFARQRNTKIGHFLMGGGNPRSQEFIDLSTDADYWLGQSIALSKSE